MSVLEIEPRELAKQLQHGPVLILDVREPEEFMAHHLPEAVNLPLSSLTELKLRELAEKHDGQALVVTVCSAGRRSMRAAQMLHNIGISTVMSLKGGMQAWLSQPSKWHLLPGKAVLGFIICGLVGAMAAVTAGSRWALLALIPYALLLIGYLCGVRLGWSRCTSKAP